MTLIPTIAPSKEACVALMEFIQSIEFATPPQSVDWGYQLPQDLSEITGVQVFVLHIQEETLADSLDEHDPTSHTIHVYVRAQLEALTNELQAELLLLANQIGRALESFISDDRRVCVMECDGEPENPEQSLSTQLTLFQRFIPLVVEVEP